jgi:uncharacterized protein YeaO (DUF488 family)
MTDRYRPPRGATGFDLDHYPDDLRTRQELFLEWAHVLAVSHDTRLVIHHDEQRLKSFTAARLQRLDCWILHNSFVGHVGVLAEEPKAGFAFAAEGTYVDIRLDDHVSGWGPTVVPSRELNRLLEADDWQDFSPAARAHSDAYKPTTVAHVLFNYWA